jgi:hypothetical protein
MHGPHYDVVDNDFMNGAQQLVAKLYRPMSQYPAGKEGDYRWTSDWHVEGECPFRDSDRLEWKAVKA